MSRRVLFAASVLRGHILVFHLPYMRWFQQQGYEVHVCARNDTKEACPAVPNCDRYVDLPFERSPLSPGNIRVYRRLKQLIEGEEYALIHCHTPTGGMMARLCARAARKRGTRVIYTAHGFHFFERAPLRNWLLYYTAERFLARYTDLLIAINQEDHRRAEKFAARKVALVRGVGIDLRRFEEPVDMAAVRARIGVPESAQTVITVGEHIPRKNHRTVLRAMALLPDVRLLFCGVGEQEVSLMALARELGIDRRVLFLGFRQDVAALLKAADLFFFPSFQEGLPVSLMEAMAAGLPCVVSRVRGNADLIRQGDGGLLREPMDAMGFAEDIRALLADQSMRQAMGEKNRRNIQPYGLVQVRADMAELYMKQLMGGEA